MFYLIYCILAIYVVFSPFVDTGTDGAACVAAVVRFVVVVWLGLFSCLKEEMKLLIKNYKVYLFVYCIDY